MIVLRKSPVVDLEAAKKRAHFKHSFPVCAFHPRRIHHVAHKYLSPTEVHCLLPHFAAVSFFFDLTL